MNATELTDYAIDQVRDNNIEFYNKALSFGYGWVKTQFKPFTSEDLKEAFKNEIGSVTHEPRVFGAVFRALAKDKLIYSTGEYKKSNNPKCHRRPQLKWISHEYRLKQQSNATRNNTLDMFNSY